MHFNRAITSKKFDTGDDDPSQGTADGATMQEPETSTLADVPRDLNMGDFSNASLETCTASPSHNSTSDSHPLVQACGAAEESHFAGKEDAICQTEECVTLGNLSIFLSMTNGAEASAQVVHIEISHKIASVDGNWKRSCGFHGFGSLKEKEEVLQDFGGVT
ncbi:uncharacterized protein LOC119381397 [Rhipicephalus sanguineus]|uniref:uncharacterized protein LOC119381397 n=1 Tax=Rhipicephalus sanguineus TaxID=34632 RepID=UPI0020C2B469|nr:uncharacterized protein LOC119381397 [Rhipicephalus sanguineus]